MHVAEVKFHARKSPSGSARWTICHASVQREGQLPQVREHNAAADVGTIMHDLAEHCLRDENDGFLEVRRGKTRAEVQADGTVIYAPIESKFCPGGHVVDDDMCDAVLRYVEFVRQMALGGDLYIEQRLSIEHITMEAGAKGTSDTVIDYGDEGCIIDLKGGYQRVMASYPFEGELFEYGPSEMKLRALLEEVRFPNTQLLMYAEAARNQFGQGWKRIRLIIAQPRLDHVDEYVLDVQDFEVWVQWIREQSLAAAQPNPRVVPSEKTCQWCKVFPCAEAQQLALQTAIDDFEDKPRDVPTDPFDLGRLKKLVPIVRMWADWVEAKVHAELEAGRAVSGWKLVDGDMGDRKWAKPEGVQETLQSFGLKPEHYTVSKIAGPAAIEKLVRRSARSKDRPLSTEQWDKLQEFITREQGAPKVVPDSDPRPARVNNPADDFDGIDNEDFFV